MLCIHNMYLISVFLLWSLDSTKALIEADTPIGEITQTCYFFCRNTASKRICSSSISPLTWLPARAVLSVCWGHPVCSEGKGVYVIMDETTDNCGRSILAILLQPVGKPPLPVDLVFLEWLKVIACLNTYNISCSDVWDFVTDKLHEESLQHSSSRPLSQHQTHHLPDTSAQLGARGLPWHLWGP